jgi:hypothetical protein
MPTKFHVPRSNLRHHDGTASCILMNPPCLSVKRLTNKSLPHVFLFALFTLQRSFTTTTRSALSRAPRPDRSNELGVALGSATLNTGREDYRKRRLQEEKCPLPEPRSRRPPVTPRVTSSLRIEGMVYRRENVGEQRFILDDEEAVVQDTFSSNVQKRDHPSSQASRMRLRDQVWLLLCDHARSRSGEFHVGRSFTSIFSVKAARRNPPGGFRHFWVRGSSSEGDLRCKRRAVGLTGSTPDGPTEAEACVCSTDIDADRGESF